MLFHIDIYTPWVWQLEDQDEFFHERGEISPAKLPPWSMFCFMVSSHIIGSAIQETRTIDQTPWPSLWVHSSLHQRSCGSPWCLVTEQSHLHKWQCGTVLPEAASLMQAPHFDSYSIFNIYTVSPGLILMVTLYINQIHSNNGCIAGVGVGSGRDKELLTYF